MDKTFTYKDVPDEVMEVWAIQMAKVPVGYTQYSRLQAIVEKYPEWFPWETKYREIPQEVHDAYFSESTKSIPVEQESGLPVVCEQISAQPGSLIELMKGLFKDEKKRRESQRRERERVKSIWDKHYAKYGLEFRE